jgi:hypothetical protein
MIADHSPRRSTDASVASPSMLGAAGAMERVAADADDQVMFEVSQLLTLVAAADERAEELSAADVRHYCNRITYAWLLTQ